MASNHTQNYGLCQWEASDAVLREDFNADNAKIDAALKAVSDGKASSAALESLRSTVSSLSSTVSSHSSSLSSHSGSISRLGNCQLYTTTYTGDGAPSKSLSFPYYPVAVLVQETIIYATHFMLRGCIRPVNDYPHVDTRVTWTSRGVSWTYFSGSGTDAIPYNRKDTGYTVLALLDMSK